MLQVQGCRSPPQRRVCCLTGAPINFAEAGTRFHANVMGVPRLTKGSPAGTTSNLKRRVVDPAIAKEAGEAVPTVRGHTATSDSGC